MTELKFSHRAQVLAALSLAVCWLSVTGCSSKHTDSTVRAGSRLDGSSFQARELRAFALLRMNLRVLPVNLRRRIRSHLSGRIRNLDVEAAGYARTSVGGIWIFSAQDTTCVARADDGAVACDSKDNFVDRGLSFAVFEAPEKTMDSLHGFVSVGVAPDWVQTARLKVGRQIRTVAVHNNNYAVRSSAPIFVVGLEGLKGKRIE